MRWEKEPLSLSVWQLITNLYEKEWDLKAKILTLNDDVQIRQLLGQRLKVTDTVKAFVKPLLINLYDSSITGSSTKVPVQTLEQSAERWA